MDSVIHAQALRKSYGNKIALENINLRVPAGRIVGLIGPNGAGKTTLLKAILGLTNAEGQLSVLGMDPFKERIKLLEKVSFIADTAILPRWLKVRDALTYVEGVHPAFSREKALGFLAKTQINQQHKVKELSKGMLTQLHLALIMSIDSQLLVLDEPTLGLDIIFRKQFYDSLLNDYHDAQKTIVITTHQVEEIEGILTDLIFINNGKIILESSMDAIPARFVQLEVIESQHAAALALKPFSVRNVLGGYAMIFENPDLSLLSTLGRTSTPSIADLFVATMQADQGHYQQREKSAPQSTTQAVVNKELVL